MPLPAPRVWTDDSTPSAIDYNLDWRDSLDFLIGTNRPMFLGVNNTAVTIGTGVNLAVPLQVESLKRGGMTHSTVTNNSRVTVPYTGQYNGYATAGFLSMTVATTTLVSRIFKNGATELIREQKRAPKGSTAALDGCFTFAFVVNLAANDYIELYQSHNATSATTSGSDTASQPGLALWYVGDYV